MRTVVFANGLIADLPHARAVLAPNDVVVAADGGARHLQALGIRPQVLIGDFDSLGPGEVEAMRLAGTEVIQHPARKDFTDLELALLHAVEQGADEILVLGALGNRWDQTLANLLLAASERFSGTPVILLDGPQELRLLRGGEKLALRGRPGDTVSLIPLFGDAVGVATHGLEYPLRGEDLSFGSTRGVSNVLLGEPASVSLREGILMCVIIHQNQ